MRLVLAIAAAAAACAAAPGHAQTVLLHEDFNAENGGNGRGVYSGFTQFAAADVDLLGPGYFFHLCQAAGSNSSCVDMEGNGNGSLTSRDAFAIDPGQLMLQFDLAGDQRNATGNSVTASLVDVQGNAFYSETFSLQWDTPFTTFSRTLAVDSAQTLVLRFTGSGRSDSYGMLLDNVTLSSVAAVPEPGSALLLAAGLGAVGRLARRRGGAAR